MTRISAHSLVGLLLISLVGCASTNQLHVVSQRPIAVDSTQCSPMAFKKLVFRIPAGTEIGHHHDGILQIPRSSHYWQSGLAVGSDEFRLIATEMMRAQGYRLLGGDDVLFGNDESAKAEYQLGGTVVFLAYDTYAPRAGGYTEASLTVEWQLYDALQRKVVFERTTSGSARADGTSIVALHNSFRRALTNLMADSMFVRALERSPREAWAKRTEGRQPLMMVRCPEADSLMLPQDMQYALRCVLLVKAGATIGSGVLISSDGYALTAAHVVSGLDEVPVQFQSGLALTATVVQVDEAQDIALIRVPGSGHSCLRLEQNGDIATGQEVFAIGAPAGEDLAFSVTKGIVSGMRDLNGFSYLQTDATLNPGNSGGPLLNSHGRVVAIVSWKIVAPGFEGLSFGVPPQAIAKRLSISQE